ncbi:MAG: carboxypeptidase-like regulatory domain-containing protein [Bacteroidetes bacterium]|nr:carboxypeptidase-like regulatory domain-containing protein [Bacteroidota bacterium]
MLRLIITLSTLFSTFILTAQPVQTLRGTVTDKASNAPVPYATVLLLNTQPALGAQTDSLGAFSVSSVPVGRYDIKISCVGYEVAYLREVVVSSAKQTVVAVALQENTYNLQTVTIKPEVNKQQPLNTMSTVSARMLSVDEANRYAGGFDDPARLASAFAGVASNSGVNGIIVRGNAPKYLQWKMEGIEIPNPNHFGDLRAFGGGILTGLSSQMLANSDFFTGAFPAEYNNAVSGVFDIALRTGNNQKRERTFQAGLIGIDVAQEGPFRKGGQASYLFNYRNSTLALLAPLLPEGANSIRYQDLSFKLNFPTQKAGTFSLWGIGLLDGASQKPNTDSTKWFYADSRQQDELKLQIGGAGLTHKYFFNPSVYLKTTLAASGNASQWISQTLNSTLELKPNSTIKYENVNYVLSSILNNKITARHSNRSGMLATFMNYSILLNKAYTIGQTPVELVNANGSAVLLSAFTGSSYILSEKLVMNAGINAQYFTLNGRYTIEPRIGLRRTLGKKHSAGLAYGLHSRLENLPFYFNNSLTTGELAVNKNLDFTKAHHAVLSYDYNVSELVHLKIEPYFQWLYSVPVIADSSFSMINLQTDWFFAEKLENTGEGRNMGVDVTLEKYISKGYYFMFTASVFDSRYRGGDGVWRNTRFNRNYVMNVLGGKEWQTGKNKQNTFSINARISYQGGNRYSPVDTDATMAARTVLYNETNAYSLQAPAVLNVHFTTSYKLNKARTTQEFAFKILNLTGQSDFYGFKYNSINNTIDRDEARVILPNLSYKIQF